MATNGIENDPEQDATPSGGTTPATGDGGDDGGGLLPVPFDFLSNLPPELQASLPAEIRAQLANRAEADGSVFHAFSASMSMTLGNIVNPIASRVTSQHITDLIGITRREVDLEYSDRRHNRIVWAAIIVTGVLCITAIAIVLIYNGLLDFLLETLKLVVPIIGGVGLGVAIGFRIGIRYANTRTRQ